MPFPWFGKKAAALPAGDTDALMRIAQPVPWQTEPFIGFGDSADAQKTFEALTGAVSTGVRAIRQRVQGLELGVFARRTINGIVEDVPAFDHPLQRLLNSPTMAEDGSITHSASQLWGMVVTHYLATGEAYLIIIHDGAGIPTNLQIQQPGTIEPVIRQGRNVGYRLISSGFSSGPRDTDLLPKDVIRIWDPDAYEIYQSSGVMKRNTSIINANAFISQTNEKFYKHNATPMLAWESTGDLASSMSPEDKKAGELSWARRLNNRVGRMLGVPVFSPLGWKLNQLSSEAESANRVAMMQYSDRRVWQALSTPASMLGDVVDANRAAAETNEHVFDKIAVLPLTMAIAEALTDQLAMHYPQNSDTVRLIVKYRPFLMPDKEFDLAQEIADAASKVRSPNEIRAAREPSLPVAPWGDNPVGTFSDVPYTGEEESIDLSGLGLEVEVDEVEEDRSERGAIPATYRQLRDHFSKENEWERAIVREARFTPRFAALQSKIFLVQGREVVQRYLKSRRERAWRRYSGVKDAEYVRAAANDILQEIMPLEGWERLFSVTQPIRSTALVSSATEASLAVTGEVFSLTQSASSILRTQQVVYYEAVNGATRNGLVDVLTKAIDSGDSVDATARKIANLFEDRADIASARRIARTEIAGAIQEGQVEGYRETGLVEKKQWNTSLDDRVRDSHRIDGQVVDLDDSFVLDNGANAPSPAHPSLDAGDRINCRCFLTPVFIGEDIIPVLGTEGSGISGFAP